MKKVKITEKNYHPIGSFFITENTESPSSLFGGTWERLPDGYTLWTTTDTITDEGEAPDNNHTGYRKIPAGMPNIIGKTTDVIYYGKVIKGEGSFVTGDTAVYWDSNKGGDYVGQRVSLGFDASKSNSIYGKSTTVQPPAYKAYIWKRVA